MTSTKNTIETILAEKPDTIFGGSLALICLGLLDRKVGDLDIIFTDIEDPQKTQCMVLLPEPTPSGPYYNTSWAVHQAVKIGDEKCCCFVIAPELATAIPAEFSGLNIHVLNPATVIKAKIEWAFVAKHRKDLEDIAGNPILTQYPEAEALVRKYIKDTEDADANYPNEDDLPF